MKLYNYKIIFSLFFIYLLFSCSGNKIVEIDNTTYINEIHTFQQNLNDEFANPKTSPLDSIDRANFKGLNFFSIDKKYRIVAKFVKNQNPKKFEFPTNTSRTPIYIKYGDAYFRLEGKHHHLEIYQNQGNLNNEEYKDFLFLPFGDKTNAYETYGGGRYIDLKIPKDSTKIVIDFNKAYNPYCAYSHRWSCPLIPQNNQLNIKIKAGIKKFIHYEISRH